jgi:hypothetical protein
MSAPWRKMFIISQATRTPFFFNFQVEPILDKLKKKQNYVGPGRQPHRPDGAQTALTTSDRGHRRLATPTVPRCHFSTPRIHHHSTLRPPPLPAIKGARPPVNSLSSSRPSPPLRRLVPLPSSHRVAPPSVPLELPVAATSTAPPCTTFPNREPSTITPRRRPHYRSPPTDRTSPQSSSFR